MPSAERVEQFMAMVEAGEYVAALETFYVEDAATSENGARPRVGRDILIAEEYKTLARNKAVRGTRLDAPAIDGDRVAIAWRFEFDGLDGVTRAMEEIAWQRWSGDRIAEERFFYDPRQLITPMAAG
ncbi:nuclear transport factor 2 family protein [Sphingomonas sp. So64.6b]|uniref:nuclear transport factor 2 family protein n=1 Tax=Sphingomonas sp. So64.6b TaxID=2997354 RepID=UPI001600CECE|nr:nuclear transport factor 2 family protein [Sphingomonas sp. So64.6b]QNA82864.1 nuclear transport factor 2 family protein [Sphingomonas sp. So64.6b]